MTAIRYAEVPSPLGPLILTRTAHGLSGVYLRHGPHAIRTESDWDHDPSAFDEIRQQLDQYFLGKLRKFEVELDLIGTPFQLTVWGALRSIGYGDTLSYRELAARIDRPRAMRAVGAANGRNPVSIIVPCHRVIGADGSLTGYGGGLEAKRYLLALESGEPLLV